MFKKTLLKKILSLIVIITLSSCYDKEDEKHSEQEIKNCFDIIKTGDVLPNKFLINRCTGETWTIQFEEYPNTKIKGKTIGDRTYRWLKINKTEDENNFRAI